MQSTPALRSSVSTAKIQSPSKTKSFGSEKMVFEGSLSFNGRESETKFSFRSPNSMKIGNGVEIPKINFSTEKNENTYLESGDERFQAALRLQKVYKSFRTRRQLADCAVLVEQRWWKLLDFAELKLSSISFFEVDQPESAVSRWSRATTRVAKVGKGLSKDERARKLALQHWLEAIDPRHRYGHNLQFYYVNWLESHSKQPFFYWLDIGEGKEVNLVDRCPRSKLQQQCIKYLGPKERKAYEVVTENGKLYYRQSGKVIDTEGGPKDTKWIFVLSTSKTLYVGMKQKGTFQHSSFLAGAATLSAGRLVVQAGILKAVWPHSGHYLPTMENFEEFMSFLNEHDVDLSIVQKTPTEEEEQLIPEIEGSDSNIPRNSLLPLSRFAQKLHSNITTLEIPKKDDMIKLLMQEQHQEHKGVKSYRLGQRLSGKWSTGAGPRIGCVRDSPWELQNRALEKVHLSPRPANAYVSPKISSLTSKISSIRPNGAQCREIISPTSRSPVDVFQVILPQIATP